MEKKLSAFEIWKMASRPKTLPAAAAPVVAGLAAAYAAGGQDWLAGLATLAAALLLQIGANLANDVFDFRRGTDTAQRLGPVRVTQAGLLTPRQVLAGMWLVFGIAALLGIYLVWVSGWPILVIGAMAILAAIAYSGGPLPFGYYGLGDLVVFIFFGPAAVCGTYYIQVKTVSAAALWTSLPVGLLIVAILVVNNLRDIETDKQTGKHTLAVRLGVMGTRWEYLALLAVSYLCLPVLALAGIFPAWTLLAWASLPLAERVRRVVWTQSGRPLNAALGMTGQLALVFAILLGIGWVL